MPLFGRGDLGRAPVTGSVDAHLEYPFKLTERMQLKVAFDLFNIVDSTRQTTLNQDGDLVFGNPNVDFQKPVTNGGAVSPAGFVNSGLCRSVQLAALGPADLLIQPLTERAPAAAGALFF